MAGTRLPDEYADVFRDALHRDPGEITEDMSIDELINNSIELLELLMAFEERYDISIDVDATEARGSVSTVGDILALARTHGLPAAANG